MAAGAPLTSRRRPAWPRVRPAARPAGSATDVGCPRQAASAAAFHANRSCCREKKKKKKKKVKEEADIAYWISIRFTGAS